MAPGVVVGTAAEGIAVLGRAASATRDQPLAELLAAVASAWAGTEPGEATEAERWRWSPTCVRAQRLAQGVLADQAPAVVPAGGDGQRTGATA